MKRLVFIFSFLVLLLTACGGDKLDLDVDKTQQAVADRALHNEDRTEKYEVEDIELVKVCEAVRMGEEQFGFDGEYIVHWQTSDGELKETYRMENYEANLSTSNLEPVSDDRCIEFD